MSVFSSIPFRLNAFVIGLLALAAVGITAVGGSLSSASFESHIRHSTFPARMDTVAGMVERELIVPARALQTVARNPFFLRWVAGGGSEEQAAEAFGMARSFAKDYGTLGMNIVLRESLRYFQIESQTEKVFTTSKERDPWFFAFEQSGKPLGVNIHAANDPLYPGMIFFNQRMELDGKFAGILSTGMKMDAVLDKLTGMTIGKRGTVMLVRADGTLLAHTNRDLAGSSLKKLPGYEKGLPAILEGRATDFEYINANGERILASSRHIPVLDLILIAEGNLHELLGGLEKARWYSIGVGLLCILVGGIVGMLLIRTVTGPLCSIMNMAEGLTHRAKAGSEAAAESADEVPLSQTHPALFQRKDELGNLARTLGTMVESLQEVTAVARQESAKALEESAKVREAMREVNLAKKQTELRTKTLMDVAGRLVGVAESVKNASESLEKYVRTADASARTQADQLGETSVAMTQMTATVLEVAQNASVASETSSATRQRAANGADVVRRAVSSITRVQEESSALKEDMGRLEQSAQSIAHIMSVISDIADQTNLLALNAAIEAARAGEAGRGFAVVADEVRKLAEKTMVSTVDVGNAIRDIQTSANTSMARMDTAVESVGEATALATESGAALDEIVTLIDDTAEQVRAIATAAEEQSAASEQINQSVSQATDGSRETTQAMDKAAQAIGELSAQARVLMGLIQELNAN